MRILGQICLLAAFVGVSYAALACLLATRFQHRTLLRTGKVSAVGGLIALTIVVAVLARALLVKDFEFYYVGQYTSQLLPWHYSLSALWVGQAGSLLLWAWMLLVLAMAFRFWPWKKPSALRDPAFGFLLAYCGFLIAAMVFGADPMQADIAPGTEGAGLSPLLQHPAMLIHPPIVFLGYAAWAVPCALAMAALVFRRKSVQLIADRSLTTEVQTTKSLDVTWVKMARPWALIAWTVLGGGILLGAYWSYEELGWGGYWAWDPVENGSLIPWLAGSALIHGMMAWQFRGVLKKTTIALSFVAFGMCNFATFLTRSGIFSSLHAFSQSTIGWLFLEFLVLFGVSGAWLILRYRRCLAPNQQLTNIWSRESFVVISIVALLLLSLITLGGTLSVALSDALVGRRIIVGPEFYNYALIPIALVLLPMLGAAPLLRWGVPPTPLQKRGLIISAMMASIVGAVALLRGVVHPLALSIAWLAAFAVFALAVSLVFDARRRYAGALWRGLISTLIVQRRSYAGFVIHLGFVSIAVGVAGSSLGSQRHELVMNPGDVVEWAGRSIRFSRIIEREFPDKFVAEAELFISRQGAQPFRLLPAQHWHRLQREWTTEVAIRRSWSGDFYTILHNREDGEAVRLTFVDNPLMRWMWFGGWVMTAGAGMRLLPARRRTSQQRPSPAPRTPQRNPASARTSFGDLRIIIELQSPYES